MINTTPATAAFDKEHSTEKYPSIYHKDSTTGAERLFFYDGATRECDPFNCSLVGPPSDPIEKQKRVLFYFRIRHQKFLTAVENLKSHVRAWVEAQRTMGTSYPPDHRLLSELERLCPLRDAAKKDFDVNFMALQKLQPETNMDMAGKKLRERKELEDLLRSVENM
jgi:hypothetical protein